MEVRDGYAQSAVGLIPGDWACKPLADFLSFISYGFTNPMPTVADGVYMITAADIDHGKLQLASARKTSISSFQKLLTAKSKPRVNDVLLTKDGSLGRLALVGEETICINQSVAVLRANEKVEPNFLKLLLESPWYQTRMLEDAGGSTIKHIYITIVDKMPIGLPLDKAEQRAIATALSDVDALIAGLEKLIAKKRDLKQAAMQQLLTGQTRLPGFGGDWVVKFLGDACRVTTGAKDVNEGNPEGQFPFFTCSRSHTFSDVYSFDTEAILIAGNGEVGNLHYFNGKFEAYQRTYVLCDFSTHVDFLWHQLSANLATSLGLGKVGSSIPYIKKSNLTDFWFMCPPTKDEQAAIALTLTNMGTELLTLESRLAKTRDLKQGMMQELLTGRTRLV